MKRAVVGSFVAVIAAVLSFAAPALAAKHKSTKTLCCVRQLRFAAGPYYVHPGSNAILIDYAHVPKPTQDGYMIRMIPNLKYAKANGKCCGAIPAVSILHLHHGVWLSDGALGAGEGNSSYGHSAYPFMATGEEKTHYVLPPGYGYPIRATDHWYFNYMIHNLTPVKATVYVTYTIYFVPENTPLAKTLTAVHPIWMDVEDHHLYPVFNVMQGSGKHGIFTFPYMAKNPYPAPQPPLNEFVVDQPGVLVATAGHVHPGGLYSQLDDTRSGTKPHGGAMRGMTPGSVRLFRSYAHYWDKRGPISWNLAMKGTAADWRPRVRQGDVLSVSATYNTTRASWYESMGIMVVWEAWDSQRGIDVFTGLRERHPAASSAGINPFSHKLDQRGYVTHGYLPENNDNGGTQRIYTINLNKLRSCHPSQVVIRNFAFNPGGFDDTGRNLCVPTVQQGQTVTFVNQDAPNTGLGFLTPGTPYANAVFHTVTSCKDPCGLNTGISYPLANGAGNFDSGQLGIGSPATGSLTWTTPTGLKPGLYTYFCRIHPFMRGVFRVVG